MTRPAGRLVIVSNRLPFNFSKSGGTWRAHPSSGGLIAAMAPVVKRRGGMWIGWTGITDTQHVRAEQLMAEYEQTLACSFKAVPLDESDREKFYLGFANETVWPLFHDMSSRANFDPAYWESYQSVNRKFARVIEQNVASDDFIWIHDYHLMNVAEELHGLGVKSRTGFFLHIPFPPMEIFLKMPWRYQVLRGLLAHDVIGFQTLVDRRNFLESIRTVFRDVTVAGKGRLVTLRTAEHETHVGVFPISIDYEALVQQASSPEVTALVQRNRQELPNRKLLLGVDRLDYTKGIPHRMRAFELVLQRFPDLRRRVTLVQVVVPSREAISQYKMLKEEIEQLVGRINGEFSRAGWVPIYYVHRSLEQNELLACYRTCDVALVTPLRDGMNLVAKEYCACNIEGEGVLVLSEFAGAAAELSRGALLVNPHDIVATADVIHQALTMTEEERRLRMRRLRRVIREHDVFWWLESFLAVSSGIQITESEVEPEALGTVPPLHMREPERPRARRT